MRAAAVVGAAVAALVLLLLAGPWAVALAALTAVWLVPGRLRRPTMRRRRRRVWTEEERQFILARDGWACVRCGAREELQIDHVIPFSRGGACSVENAAVLCGPCNRAKGAS